MIVQPEMKEDARTTRKRLAKKGALIVGGVVAGCVAISAIIKIDDLNKRLNYAEDRGSEFVDAINQLLDDVATLKGE